MKNFLARLAQIAISVCIFFVFVLYILQVQLAYVQADGLKSASLFAIIIFGGSFSYDIIKSLAMMEPTKFWVFSKSLGQSFAYLILLSVLFVISAILLNSEHFSYNYWGFWFYLGALITTYWVIKHATKAIEIATSPEN